MHTVVGFKAMEKEKRNLYLQAYERKVPHARRLPLVVYCLLFLIYFLCWLSILLVFQSPFLFFCLHLSLEHRHLSSTWSSYERISIAAHQDTQAFPILFFPLLSSSFASIPHVFRVRNWAFIIYYFSFLFYSFRADFVFLPLLSVLYIRSGVHRS